MCEYAGNRLIRSFFHRLRDIIFHKPNNWCAFLPAMPNARPHTKMHTPGSGSKTRCQNLELTVTTATWRQIHRKISNLPHPKAYSGAERFGETATRQVWFYTCDEWSDHIPAREQRSVRSRTMKMVRPYTRHTLNQRSSSGNLHRCNQCSWR